MPQRPDWHKDAACKNVDVDVFVGTLEEDGTYSQRTALATRYCNDCPVSDPCFDEAMANPQLLGVWGGKTTTQRLNLRRKAS